MRILNLIKVSDKGIEIIRSFPIVEEQFSTDVIQQAESMLIERVFGIMNDNIHFDDVLKTINASYDRGVYTPDHNTYMLLWSDIDV